MEIDDNTAKNEQTKESLRGKTEARPGVQASSYLFWITIVVSTSVAILMGVVYGLPKKTTEALLEFIGARGWKINGEKIDKVGAEDLIINEMTDKLLGSAGREVAEDETGEDGHQQTSA